MQTKKCNQCKERKEVDKFYKQSNGMLGVTGECKECRKARVKTWTLENKEHKSIVGKLHYQTIDRTEYNRKWREENPNYFRERRQKLKQEK